MAEKSLKKLGLYGLLVFLLLFGFANITKLHGKLFFKLEWIGILTLLFISFLGLSYYKSWGERALLFVFMMCLGNLVLIWYFLGQLYLVLLVLSLLGFILTIPEKKNAVDCCPQQAPEISVKVSKVPQPPEKKEAEEVKEDVKGNKEEVKKADAKEIKEVKKVSKAKHSPGKYVASKRSNIYHEPRCEWAKKIKEERRLWFAEKEEAQGKGYRKHECVK